MFLRNVYAPGAARRELYHLAINGAVYNDTTLPLNRYVSRTDTYTVTIEDGDDRPISIKGITVRYYADDLVFEGPTVKTAGETYTLEFGNDSVRAAPVYDIGRYRNEILKGPVERLPLGTIRYAEEAPKRQIIDPKIIFNIVIIVIALLLGVLIVLKLKRNGE
jgi:preprotein translocase subunit Sec61beta